MNLQDLKSVRNYVPKNLILLVENSLLDFIRTQNLTSGDALPAQSVLAKSLGVSLSTLREALSRLEERGIINVEHGKGTYINKNLDQVEKQIDLNLSLTQMIREQGLIPGTREISVCMEPLPNYFWGCFGGNKEDKYLCVRRVRTANDEPFAYSVGYLSNKFTEYADAFSNYRGSIYEFIERNTRESISLTEVVIHPDKADGFLAEKLNVEIASPLLTIRQIHSNSNRCHLIVSKDTFPQSNLKLTVKISTKQK